MRPKGTPAKPSKPKKERKPGPIMSKGAEMRKLYESDPNVTVYTLAERYGCSISAIHRSLVRAGTTMRRGGGDYRSKRARGLLAWLDSDKN